MSTLTEAEEQASDVIDEKEKTAFRVLSTISVAHCLNDTTQSLLIAIYPMLRDNFELSFLQVGFLSFTYQMCASVLQPLIGRYTDKRPLPYSLPVGMSSTLVGLLIMAFAANYFWLLIGSAMVGIGSAVFHPESSRVAHKASAGRYGLAQSIFQVGGNAGAAIGPLLAIFVANHGQISLTYFAFLPFLAIITLFFISRWSVRQAIAKAKARAAKAVDLPRSTIMRALGFLLLLMFSKQVYTMSISTFFIFYLQEKFDVSMEAAQMYLFLFLGATALGTFAGGPIGDRFGRKWVIWLSILGAAPFALALPYAGLFSTAVLAIIIGFIMASSFSAILVFAQELMPGHVGTIAGLFFGLSFGLGGIGSAVLGAVADGHGLTFVYQICSFLPLLGLLTIFLPSEKKIRQMR